MKYCFNLKKGDLRQVDDFLQVLQLPPPIKLTPRYS